MSKWNFLSGTSKTPRLSYLVFHVNNTSHDLLYQELQSLDLSGMKVFKEHFKIFPRKIFLTYLFEIRSFLFIMFNIQFDFLNNLLHPLKLFCLCLACRDHLSLEWITSHLLEIPHNQPSRHFKPNEKSEKFYLSGEFSFWIRYGQRIMFAL